MGRLPAALLVLAAALLLSSSHVVANKFTVGDEKGWNSGVNYTTWVKKHQPFYVGDWLGNNKIPSSSSSSSSSTSSDLMLDFSIPNGINFLPVFYYQSGMADVVQVADEAAYNKCDSSNPVTNYSRGRSYAFELNETRHYYFICSYGYCYQGMKLSIKVLPLPPPSPPPSHNSGAAVAGVLSAAVGVVAAILTWVA